MIELCRIADEIFLRACELDTASQREYVDRACHNDETLRSEVEKLLNANELLEQGCYDTELADAFARLDHCVGETQAPARIGHYRLDSLIGKGTYGRVYAGYDENLHRRIAVKLPRLQQQANAAPFLKEARNLARLQHPHIVTVHDFGMTSDGLCYVVCEYIEGGSLDARMKASRFGQSMTVGLVAKIARALQHAHSKGLYHRDVKPGNILLNSAGEPILADFGLAMTEQDWSLENQVLGTPAYMSPEQARGEGHRVDGRSDIFSLGAVLYELLTGQRPFVGGGAMDVIARVQSQSPQPPCELDGSIAPELQRICLKAMAKNPAERYQTADAFADDLARFLQSQSETVHSVDPPVGVVAGCFRTVRRRPVRSILTALMLIVCCGMPLAFRSFADNQSAPPPTDPNVLRVGIKPWVGYCPLAVAKEMDLCDPVKLEFVEVGGLEDARRLLDKGEIDVAMWLVDTHVLARSSGIKTKVVLKLDDSLEADAFVAREEITDLRQLKGQTVAYQYKEASHFLLLALCEKYGLDAEHDIHLQPTSAKGAADEFINDPRVAAAGTYDPHLFRALNEVPGAHRLASGADARGAIVDVLTVREDYLQDAAQRRNVQCLIQGWFAAVEKLSRRDSPDHPQAVKFACEFFDDYAPNSDGASYKAADYYEMESGMRYASLEDNLAYFQVGDDGSSAFRQQFNHAQDRWSKHHQMGPATHAEDGDGSKILLQMYQP